MPIKQRQLRFSLGARISAHYAGRLFLSILPHLVLFAIGFAVICAIGYHGAYTDALDAAASGRAPAYANTVVRPAAENEPRFQVKTRSESVFVELKSDETMVSLNVTDMARLLIALLILLAALDLLRVFRFARSGRDVSAKLFRPIDEIARIAQNLSDKNLSERINIEGTNNELRDLAGVINDMLDRIENAYNNQKQFVSDASHELRTPIAVIQGYAEMLDRWGKTEPEVRDEAIAAILSESRGMKELVEKLLFLARHDKNTLTQDRTFFDAAELVDEVIRETKVIAVHHTVTRGAIVSVIIPGDRAALKQMLRIFVENAIKYTPEGGDIGFACGQDGAYCRISVSDSGIGIEKKDLPRIFDRFYRSDASRTGGAEGHGLGLAIARIIVQQHGGKIEVGSRPGAGSRFQILLPVQ